MRRNFKFADLDREWHSTRAMRAAGQAVADDIKQRTTAGRAADGRAFERGADGGPVDLKATGQMLNDLVVIEATDRSVKVGFRTERSERIARYHEEGTKHMPARPFMRLGRAALDRVLRVFRERVGK